MGYFRGMIIDKEDKKHCRKCDNCSEIQLTPDHILNCPAIIPNLLKIAVLPTAIDLHNGNNGNNGNNYELIAKAVIDVHGHI